MTTSQDMIRGRSNVVTLTNNSGGALVAGDVCIQDTTADENVTTTTTAADTKKVFIAAESIASGAAGRFYESGYCPLVNVNASVTRGHFLFTHTVAKQAAGSATYAAGAFGKILKSSATPSAIIYSQTAQIGGSGGNVTFESAYASPPAMPNSGDLWLINNSFLSARYNGSAWSYYYGSRHVIKPPTSWTWYNQGSATYTDLGHVTLYSPGATTNMRGIYQAVTSNAFSCEAILKPFKPYNANNANAAGMFLTDGTKALTFGFTTGTNDIYIEVDQFTNGTTYNSSPLSAVWRYYALVDYLYLRIRETGGTRYFEVSPDGVNYQTMRSETIAGSFLTPTGCGIGLETESATYFNSVTLLHWNQS